MTEHVCQIFSPQPLTTLGQAARCFSLEDHEGQFEIMNTLHYCEHVKYEI